MKRRSFLKRFSAASVSVALLPAIEIVEKETGKKVELQETKPENCFLEYKLINPEANFHGCFEWHPVDPDLSITMINFPEEFEIRYVHRDDMLIRQYCYI